MFRSWLTATVVATAVASSLTTAPTLKLDATDGARREVVRPDLFGHDLEFTRHDVWEGLSSEMLANRKLAVAPPLQPFADNDAPVHDGGGGGAPGRTFVVPRWAAVGAVVAEDPGYAGGLARALRCDVSAVACGVTQSQVGDGYNSGMSAGSAIAVRANTSYTLRLILRATTPGGGGSTALVMTASVKTSAGTELLPATAGAISIPGNSSWIAFTRSFVATENDDNATLALTTAVGNGVRDSGATPSHLRHLRAAFDRFDRDGDGRTSRQELSLGLLSSVESPDFYAAARHGVYLFGESQCANPTLDALSFAECAVAVARRGGNGTAAAPISFETLVRDYIQRCPLKLRTATWWDGESTCFATTTPIAARKTVKTVAGSSAAAFILISSD